MECTQIPVQAYGLFSQALHRQVAGKRIPLAGSVELTFRCNLRCVHCYAADGASGSPHQGELSSTEFDRIFGQVADEGTLWLQLTGGEPLVRSDFREIYLSAKRKGLLINFFTNGTLLTPAIADFLAEWRPFTIEITLYGGTQETYERITGVPGSYARCRRGIELLLERKLPLKLKTMLMTLNRHELEIMQSYAQSLGVEFRFDPMLNPTLGRSASPTQYRLSPEEIVQFDLADERRMKDYKDFSQRMQNTTTDQKHLYACGAGFDIFHIDPYGKLTPCMMSRSQGFDLRKATFQEGWQQFLRQVHDQPLKGDYKCLHCRLLPLCGQCPGWGTLESGDPQQPVDFLCATANLRAKALSL